jgi:pSer/pThr/pTyr-binding forkhead associated (FHA) protein
MPNAPRGSSASVRPAAPGHDLAAGTGPQGVPWRAGAWLAWLLVVRSEDEQMEGRLLALTAEETTLGRGNRDSLRSGAHHLFDDLFMSDPHVVISRPGGQGPPQLRERPGPSTNNGTFVNGRRISADEVVELRDGDLVQLGTTALLVKTLWLERG